MGGWVLAVVLFLVYLFIIAPASSLQAPRPKSISLYPVVHRVLENVRHSNYLCWSPCLSQPQDILRIGILGLAWLLKLLVTVEASLIGVAPERVKPLCYTLQLNLIRGELCITGKVSITLPISNIIYIPFLGSE